MKHSVWACNCPICRIMVHKVMGKIVGGTYVTKGRKEKIKVKSLTETRSEELSEEMSRKIGNRPVEVAKLSEVQQEKTQPTPQMQPNIRAPQQVSKPTPIQKESKKKEEEKEEVKQIQVQIPPEIVEKISSLENEVTEIKKYIKTSVEGIKATLIDLRSAVAEIDNPFNILRKYGKALLSEEQIEESSQENVQNMGVNAQPPVLPVAQYPPIQPYTPIAHYASLHQTVKTVENTKVGESVEEKHEKSEEVVKKEGKINFNLYTRLVEWVNKITEHVPPDVLEKLISSYVEIGVIDESIGNVLRKIVKTVNELKSLNLSVDEQAKYLHELIQALGLTNGDIAQKVIPAAKKTEEKMAQELLELMDKKDKQYSRG